MIEKRKAKSKLTSERRKAKSKLTSERRKAKSKLTSKDEKRKAKNEKQTNFSLLVGESIPHKGFHINNLKVIDRIACLVTSGLCL